MSAKARDKKKARSSKGGTMAGMRRGMRGLVGSGGSAPKKESLLSKVLSYLLLAAAVGLLIYRFTR